MGTTKYSTNDKKTKSKETMKIFALTILGGITARPSTSVCDNCPSSQTCYYAATKNTQFIECCNGNEHVLDCPPTYFWDDGLKSCSSVKPDPVNPVDPLPPNNICSNCPWDIQCYFSVDNDSSKFIQCSNGKPITMTCPTGLVFNSDLNVCDWPPHVTYCDTQCPEQSCILPSPDSYIQYFNCPSGLQNCPLDSNEQQTLNSLNVVMVMKLVWNVQQDMFGTKILILVQFRFQIQFLQQVLQFLHQIFVQTAHGIFNVTMLLMTPVHLSNVQMVNQSYNIVP